MKKIRKGYLVRYIDTVYNKSQKKGIKIPKSGIWDGKKVVLNDKEETVIYNKEWLEVIKGNLFIFIRYSFIDFIEKKRIFNKIKIFFLKVIEFIISAFIISVPLAVYVYFMQYIFPYEYKKDITEIILYIIFFLYIGIRSFIDVVKFNKWFDNKYLKINNNEN